jgi:hypothetical protein
MRMTREQQLALDALENYVTTIKRLQDLQHITDGPYVVVPILFALYDLPSQFIQLGDYYCLDFRRQIQELKSQKRP